MSRILILGAAGSLGRQVTQQALALGHEVSTVVRDPTRLPRHLRERVVVHQADLAAAPVAGLASLFQDHEAVINTAGFVTQGHVFVDLVDRLVTTLDSLPARGRPVCWFLAGAALLDIDGRGRRGVDLPRIAATYWPHRANFARIRRSALDWRILCPGPMVDQEPLGLARMRISVDRLPVAIPRATRMLPRPLVLPLFAWRVPEMIIPYADAAALMLANLAPAGVMSRRRVGLALPVGMRGRKPTWSAAPRRES